MLPVCRRSRQSGLGREATAGIGERGFTDRLSLTAKSGSSRAEIKIGLPKADAIPGCGLRPSVLIEVDDGGYD
jgi:hypothetical protein